jgi:hypothetical protein
MRALQHINRSTTMLALSASALFVGGVWLVLFMSPTKSPTIPLSEGGEFRVIQVIYSAQRSDHVLGGAPKHIRRLWSHSPSLLQRVIPEPTPPYSTSFPPMPAISIWWTWIDPTTGRPELGPSGDALLTLDDGRQISLQYPDPVHTRDDEERDPGYRVIWIHDPPADSKRLRLHVPVEGEAVDFEIENPGYRK